MLPSASTFRKLFSTFTSSSFPQSILTDSLKVHDIPSTYSQPWPFSTLSQTFVTSLIILLSLQSLQARLSNWCPPANLTRDLIVVYTAPCSNPCLFSVVLQCFMLSLLPPILTSALVSDQESFSSLHPFFLPAPGNCPHSIQCENEVILYWSCREHGEVRAQQDTEHRSWRGFRVFVKDTWEKWMRGLGQSSLPLFHPLCLSLYTILCHKSLDVSYERNVINASVYPTVHFYSTPCILNTCMHIFNLEPPRGNSSSFFSSSTCITSLYICCR